MRRAPQPASDRSDGQLRAGQSRRCALTRGAGFGPHHMAHQSLDPWCGRTPQRGRRAGGRPRPWLQDCSPHALHHVFPLITKDLQMICSHRRRASPTGLWLAMVRRSAPAPGCGQQPDPLGQGHTMSAAFLRFARLGRRLHGITVAMAATAVIAVGLSACGDTTPGSPTSTAAQAPAGTLNSEAQKVSPAAPDSPASGNSGHRGMSPVPDSSEGPSSGSTSNTPGNPPGNSPNSSPGQARQ